MLTAYTHAITDIFLLAIPVIVVALVVVLFLKEIPLRTGQPDVVKAAEADEAIESDAQIPAFSGH